MEVIKKLFRILFILTLGFTQSSFAGPNYCTPARKIKVNFISEQSRDVVDQLMRKFSPYAWLSKQEQYKGLSLEEYISNPYTQVVFKPNHRNDSRGEKTVVIPPGNITMEKLFCLKNTPEAQKFCKKISIEAKDFKHKFNQSHDDLYLEGPNCLDAGSHPNTTYESIDGTMSLQDEENGIKQTPIYAFYSETEAGRAYIQYFYFYGYNGAYGQHIPLPVLSHIDVWHTGNHKMDLEHFTLEFDKTGDGSKIGDYKLKRLGFNSHGHGEMKWMKAEDKDLEFYDDTGKISKTGTHPEVFLADKGHGFYPPPPGTWLRLCGQANEICDRGQLWKGRVVRLERPENKNFNPTTMGIVGFPGDLGPEGVGGFAEKNYTGNAQHEEGGLSKNDFKKVHCEEGNIFYNELCVGVTRPYSCYIPQDYTATIASGHEFAPNLLPPDSIQVSKGTTLIFKKHQDKTLSLEHSNKATIQPQSINIELLSLVPDPVDAVEISETEQEISVTFNKLGIVGLTFFEGIDEIYDTEEDQEDRNNRRDEHVKKNLHYNMLKETSVHVK